jgi:hypothetical protein
LLQSHGLREGQIMRMKFGKFHGTMLVLLGVLLLGLQAWLITSSHSVEVEPGGANVTSGQERKEGRTAEHHDVSKLPAVLGGASLLLGAAVFYSHRRQPADQRG